jgi:hypothetical protein
MEVITLDLSVPESSRRHSPKVTGSIPAPVAINSRVLWGSIYANLERTAGTLFEAASQWTGELHVRHRGGLAQ